MRLPTGRFHLRALAGSGAAVGDTPVWTGTEYKPTAPASGASPLGFATVTLTLATPTSNGTVISATAATLGTTDAAHGISIAAGPPLAISLDVGLYHVVGRLNLTPATNAVAGDAHHLEFTALGFSLVAALVGNAGPNALHLAFTKRQSTSGSTGSAALTARCTGGTNRTYTIHSTTLYITRFAIPV